MKKWNFVFCVAMLLFGGCMTPFYGDKALSVTEGKDKAEITFDPRGQQIGMFYFTKTDDFDSEKSFPAYESHPVMTLPVEGSIEMYVNGRFYDGYHVHVLNLGWRSSPRYIFWSDSIDIWVPIPAEKITAGTSDLSIIDTNVTTVVVMGDLSKFVKANRHWRMYEPPPPWK